MVNKQLRKAVRSKETFLRLVTDKSLQIRDLEIIEQKVSANNKYNIY